MCAAPDDVCSGEVSTQAIADAVFLVDYAARRGLPIESDDIRTIVAAGRRDGDEAWPADEESAFWSSFGAVTRAIRPASIESIQATRKRVARPNFVVEWLCRQFPGKIVPRRDTDAYLAERRVRTWSLVSLLLLLMFQIYWVIGNTIVNRIDSLGEEIEQVTQAKRQLLAENDNNVTNFDSPETKMRFDNLGERQLSLGQEYAASLAALKQINFAEPIFVGEKLREQLRNEIPAEENKQTNSISLMVIRFVLQILSVYILPLLYGWLGACAYVIRQLSEEIKNVAYTRASNMNYRLRMYLGALSGLVLSWLVFDPGGSVLSLENVGGIEISNLSPFALAFVAGYSVEVLFTALDRIVGAFTPPRDH